MNRILSTARLAIFLFILSAGPIMADETLSELVAAFDTELTSNGGRRYQESRDIAEQIFSLGEKKSDDSLRVRGLIRLGFVELYFCKWGNQFKEKLKRCETLLNDMPHGIAHIEFNMYRGLMLGIWQDDIPGGLERLETAILLAEQLREDELLARSFSHAARLYGFNNDEKRMLEYAERAYIISQHTNNDSVRIQALTGLVSVLSDIGQLDRAGKLAIALKALAPNSPRARWALFCVGKDDEFVNVLDKNSARYLDVPKEKISPKMAEFVANQNTILASAYKKLGELKKASQCCQTAMEYCQISGNKKGYEFAGYGRRLIEIMMLESDLKKLSRLVQQMEDANCISSAEECGAIAKAYERLGEFQQSTKWLAKQVELSNANAEVKYRYIQNAAEDYWQSELKARKQIDLVSNQKQQSEFANYLLTSFIVVGLGLMAICFTWLRGTRIQKDKLARLVDDRTQSLIAANEKSEAANLAKSEFLARINHEIRNPLTAILGYCELMQMESQNNSSDQEILASGLMASSRHLLELVDDVLVVSRIESNEIDSNEHSFELRKTVTDINRIISDSAKEKSLEFECKIEGNSSHQLFGDETKLRQIVLNLLSNAIKFTDKGKVKALFSVQVGEADKGDLTVTVSDTGRGIPIECQANVFDKFARGNHQIDGTGLGLHICKKLVEHLNGSISLESSEVGTSFKFNIPVIVIGSHQSDEAGPQSFKREENNIKILVVDDQQSVRDTIRKRLNFAGYDAKCSDSISETLGLIREWNPHVVLLDLRMPGQDGYTVRSTIKMQHPSTPVVAMTGDATAEIQKKCEDLGFDGFLTKPFDMRRIAELVNVLVHSNL